MFIERWSLRSRLINRFSNSFGLQLATLFILATTGMLTTTYLWGPKVSLMIAVFGNLIIQILLFIWAR